MYAHYAGITQIVVTLGRKDRKLLDQGKPARTYLRGPKRQVLELTVKEQFKTKDSFCEPGIDVRASPRGWEARTFVKILMNKKTYTRLVTSGYTGTRWIGDRVDITYWEPGFEPERSY